MTSIRDRDAGRDAASYHDDRKDGVYSPGGSRAHWFPVEPASVPELHPDSKAVLDKAMAQIERAFSRPNGIEPMFPKAPVRREAA